MKNVQFLLQLTDKCDIYYENALISNELIIKTYADFLTSLISKKGHKVSVALHTGSICFDIISIITVALACVFSDETDTDSIIASINIGEIVLYRNERYRWGGTKIINGMLYMILEQDGRGKNGMTINSILYETNKGLIRPYYGDAAVTDGRGLKRKKNNRVDFISHIFDVDANEVPSITGVSTVVIADRALFDSFSKNINIVYGNGKNIKLLDLVTASYFSDNCEEYQYGSNPTKSEPVLKITSKISTARDLVLSKHGNKTIGLMVLGIDAVSKNSIELSELFGRKALKFAHISSHIDSEFVENIINLQEDAHIYACTKEFLKQNSMPIQNKNDLTIELDRQINNIINYSLETTFVEGEYIKEDVYKLRETLNIIRKSDWNEVYKNRFLMFSYSLLNLFVTAIFPIELLEIAINDRILNTGIASPSQRIRELSNFAEKPEHIEVYCKDVIVILEQMYHFGYTKCLKLNAINQHLKYSTNKRIAIIVPKTYYVDVIRAYDLLTQNDITIITSNRFENSKYYDEIIVIGDFIGKKFNPFKCRAAKIINVFLYDSEYKLFDFKRRKAVIFDRTLNSKLGILCSSAPDYLEQQIESNDYSEMVALTEEENIDRYFDKITTLDFGKFSYKTSSTTCTTMTSDIVAIGQFVNGEQILFSKYYKAVVFDSIKGTVNETDVSGLNSGDQLVFAKRDDNTKNMVDFVYENLQNSGLLKAEVVVATEKSTYWKEVIREYKNKHNLSYRELSRELQKIGNRLQEVTIRQWLIEESHIVGPRDEITFEQIALLTQDSNLLNDAHGYFEACRIVRHQRKEILEFIGKAISDKLSGHEPIKGSVLEVVHANVENLSEMYELDDICLFDNILSVPIYLINKPITDWEAVYE